LLNDLRSYLNGSSEFLISFYTCFFRDGLVKQVIEYMDMGSLKGLTDLVAKKKIVITEEELAVIIYKVTFILIRFLMACFTFMIYAILFIGISNHKIFYSIQRDRLK
jgi:hypothetical protein